MQDDANQVSLSVSMKKNKKEELRVSLIKNQNNTRGGRATRNVHPQKALVINDLYRS